MCVLIFLCAGIFLYICCRKHGQYPSFCLPTSTDDLEVAPDFFSYFQATRPLLATDKKLWCVSAWNDNGKEMHIDRKSIGGLI